MFTVCKTDGKIAYLSKMFFIIHMKRRIETHIHINNTTATIDISACRTYGNFLQIPGLGHFEIKYKQAIFNLLWNVILFDLAKLLGFRSLKPLLVVKLLQTITSHGK